MGAIIFLCIYFLPGIIASTRGHHNAVAIWVLNLFLGWTALGWIISLVWSMTSAPQTIIVTQVVTAPPVYSQPQLLPAQPTYRPLEQFDAQPTAAPLPTPTTPTTTGPKTTMKPFWYKGGLFDAK